jgi:hypothetical protein
LRLAEEGWTGPKARPAPDHAQPVTGGVKTPVTPMRGFVQPLCEIGTMVTIPAFFGFTLTVTMPLALDALVVRLSVETAAGSPPRCTESAVVPRGSRSGSNACSFAGEHLLVLPRCRAERFQMRATTGPNRSNTLAKTALASRAGCSLFPCFPVRSARTLLVRRRTPIRGAERDHPGPGGLCASVPPRHARCRAVVRSGSTPPSVRMASSDRALRFGSMSGFAGIHRNVRRPSSSRWSAARHASRGCRAVFGRARAARGF